MSARWDINMEQSKAVRQIGGQHLPLVQTEIHQNARTAWWFCVFLLSKHRGVLTQPWDVWLNHVALSLLRWTSNYRTSSFSALQRWKTTASESEKAILFFVFLFFFLFVLFFCCYCCCCLKCWKKYVTGDFFYYYFEKLVFSTYCVVTDVVIQMLP